MADPGSMRRHRAFRRKPAVLLASAICALTLSAADEGEVKGIVPDFSGPWALTGNAFDFGPPSAGAGPGPLVNTSGDRLVPVGNHDSPLLKPWAAEAVKKHGDILLAGKLAPDAHTACYPMGLPYVLQVRDNVWLLQTPEWITIAYQNGSQRRLVHMNAAHTTHAAPSWFGESVGHYEGDALIVDTIGIAVHELSAIDRFGTPHTDAMHVVERYRVADNRRSMRVDFTVDDPGAFNTPWDASVTYGRGTAQPGEYVCAENTNNYFHEDGYPVPATDKPDF
jgi:hypothetical protein